MPYGQLRGGQGTDNHHARLREEIAYMEARLNEIGYDGDCAYEKAMVRFFTEQVEARRAELGWPTPGAAIA